MLRRRPLLLSALAAAALPPVRAEDVAAFRRAAFDARSLAACLQALGLPAPTPSTEVTLQAPDLFEDGSVVPFTIGCALPGVQRLLLGIDRNPTFLTAIFEPGEALAPSIGLRVKMQESSRAVVLAQLKDGRLLMAAKDVKITLGGCGGPPDAVPQRADQPTLIRVQPAAGGATVRALMKHQMETGQRKDEAGRPLPAWHIQEVVARVNGEPVLRAQWGTAVAKNPFLQFGLKQARPGDRIALAWADNRGAERSDEATVA